MANQEQLEILKQGVEVWNRWREENPEVRPELRSPEIKTKPFLNIAYARLPKSRQLCKHH